MNQLPLPLQPDLEFGQRSKNTLATLAGQWKLYVSTEGFYFLGDLFTDNQAITLGACQYWGYMDGKYLKLYPLYINYGENCGDESFYLYHPGNLFIYQNSDKAIIFPNKLCKGSPSREKMERFLKNNAEHHVFSRTIDIPAEIQFVRQKPYWYIQHIFKVGDDGRCIVFLAAPGCETYYRCFAVKMAENVDVEKEIKLLEPANLYNDGESTIILTEVGKFYIPHCSHSHCNHVPVWDNKEIIEITEEFVYGLEFLNLSFVNADYMIHPVFPNKMI